jgi:fructokinase
MSRDNRPDRACIFGEVLFDRFPDGRRVLGGAPFNVAWHLRAFGEDPWLVSRVGDDEDGATVRAAMRDWGMDASGLQTDPQLPTGRVQVSIEDGEPAYDIVCPAAWDAIEAPGRLESGPCCCALLYHGSLALRRESSHAATRVSRSRDGVRRRQPAAALVGPRARARGPARRPLRQAQPRRTGAPDSR